MVCVCSLRQLCRYSHQSVSCISLYSSSVTFISSVMARGGGGQRRMQADKQCRAQVWLDITLMATLVVCVDHLWTQTMRTECGGKKEPAWAAHDLKYFPTLLCSSYSKVLSCVWKKKKDKNKWQHCTGFIVLNLKCWFVIAAAKVGNCMQIARCSCGELLNCFLIK